MQAALQGGQRPACGCLAASTAALALAVSWGPAWTSSSARRRAPSTVSTHEAAAEGACLVGHVPRVHRHGRTSAVRRKIMGPTGGTKILEDDAGRRRPERSAQAAAGGYPLRVRAVGSLISMAAADVACGVGMTDAEALVKAPALPPVPPLSRSSGRGYPF